MPIISSYDSFAKTSLDYILPSPYNRPAFVMTGSLSYLILPVWLPVASIALTTLSDSLSATSPKTTCFPSSQEVTTVVMKN